MLFQTEAVSRFHYFGGWNHHSICGTSKGYPDKLTEAQRQVCLVRAIASQKGDHGAGCFGRFLWSLTLSEIQLPSSLANRSQISSNACPPGTTWFALRRVSVYFLRSPLKPTWEEACLEYGVVSWAGPVQAQDI